MKSNKVAKWKLDTVKDLASIIAKYKVIAIADLTSLPSYQLQKIRSKIKENAEMRVSRNNLIKIALDSIKSRYSNIEKLDEYINGVVTLILTNEGVFKLIKIVNELKTPAAAKPGQIAPNDIKIPAGPTPFPPGPIIGEFGKIGLKTAVESGKISIKEEKVVVRKGEPINKDVAGVLAKLKIEPIELGINLAAVYEDGILFTGELLRTNESKYISNIKSGALESLKLALSICYPAKETIKYLIQDAYRKSKALAKFKGIEINEVIAEQKGEEIMKKDEKMDFEDNEKVAQDVLKKLQDEKMQKGRT